MVAFSFSFCFWGVEGLWDREREKKSDGVDVVRGGMEEGCEGHAVGGGYWGEG